MSRKSSLLAACSFLAACSSNSGSNEIRSAAAPVKQTATEDASSKDNFAFDQNNEDELDHAAAALTEPGEAIVALYFRGGSAKDCAKWSLEIKGEGLHKA